MTGIGSSPSTKGGKPVDTDVLESEDLSVLREMLSQMKLTNEYLSLLTDSELQIGDS